MRRHKCLQESGGSDKRCEKTERLLSVPSLQKTRSDSKLYQAVQQPDKTGLRSQRELERHLVFPVPLKLTSTTFNMTLRVCTIPSNMANVVIMLPISAEGYLLQEALPDFPGSLGTCSQNTTGLLSFTTLLTVVIKYRFI